MLAFESVSRLLMQFMRLLPPSLDKLYNSLNPLSMGAKVLGIPTPRHPVLGQGAVGQFTRTEHKGNTND